MTRDMANRAATEERNKRIEIEKERDRYREALEKITEFSAHPNRIDDSTAYSVAVGSLNIAREALKGDDDD